jgi:hypothetical protein
MSFKHFNLNSPARQALWEESRLAIRSILEQIRADVFDGEATIKEDFASPYSGLARPNLALGSTGDLRGFIGISPSPKQEGLLRVLVSNGHTASRYDTPPQELEKTVEKALGRWLSQPMYQPGS